MFAEFSCSHAERWAGRRRFGDKEKRRRGESRGIRSLLLAVLTLVLDEGVDDNGGDDSCSA